VPHTLAFLANVWASASPAFLQVPPNSCLGGISCFAREGVQAEPIPIKLCFLTPPRQKRQIPAQFQTQCAYTAQSPGRWPRLQSAI